MADLRLAGCRSRPLIGYLKALGVLRVSSRQVDASARGRWQDGVFELRSVLDRDELQRFLRSHYLPTAVLSPWNGRSGFYPKGNTTAAAALARIERSTADRLGPYRAAIAQAREALERLGIEEKPGDDRPLKARLIRDLRRTWSDEAVEWLDAAVVLAKDDVQVLPILGPGGLDGSFDFSSNYMQAIAKILDDSDVSRQWLEGALFGSATPLEDMSLAHFLRDASPTNSPYGEADSLGNPWDLVLAVEGTLLLVAGVARRYGVSARGGLVAPFAARPTSTGYASALDGEAGRAELWLPLWPGWASCAEIATLTRESRAQVRSGVRSRQAATGLDFARAAGELGVARGIEAFERYAILERAGQSSLAVPAGRVSVSSRPSADALRSIDQWLTRVLRFIHSDRCPRSLKATGRHLEQVAFQLASRGTKQDACAMLEALGEVEHSLARSARRTIDAGFRPLQGIAPRPWIQAADDGSPEFAVAAAIGSLHDLDRSLPALRDYLHGTRGRGAAFDPDRRHAVEGIGVTALLAAVHVRRHLDAWQGSKDQEADQRSDRKPDRHRPLSFERGSWGDLGTARMFAAGVPDLDDERILRLVRGLALLDQRRGPAPLPAVRREQVVPQPTFDVLALAWMGSRALAKEDRIGRHVAAGEQGGPATEELTQVTGHPDPDSPGEAPAEEDGGEPIRDGRQIERRELYPRPGWARSLASGATKLVVDQALLRLRMAHMEPILHRDDVVAGAPSGPRLASALLIPLSPASLRQLERKLTVLTDQDNHPMEDTR